MTGERRAVKEKCVCKGDSLYPEALQRISHHPGKLYYRGCLPAENIPAVAIVGARKCSGYGKEMAEWFAGALARAGVQIVSGMALGIDGVAQRAALRAGGKSFGVLGCGTDICYPGQNRDLYEMLLERGGILSEHCAGTPPLPGHFPSRNRLISALSDIVLVIEAKERSGSLITVDFALEQGKDVYALPGRTTDVMSCGCNRLIRQGAGIALEPSDILEMLREKGRDFSEITLKQEKTGKRTEEDHKKFFEKLNRQEKMIWNIMGSRPISLQELYERIKSCEDGNDMELPEVMDMMMSFVLKGMIFPVQGNRYEKKIYRDF